MGHIYFKPMGGPQTSHQRGSHSSVYLGNLATDAAYEVEVVAVVGRVVGRCAVSEMCMGDESELFQEVEGAVHRGNVERR